MSSGGLFGGDPGLLLLDGEGDALAPPAAPAPVTLRAAVRTLNPQRGAPVEVPEAAFLVNRVRPGAVVRDDDDRVRRTDASVFDQGYGGEDLSHEDRRPLMERFRAAGVSLPRRVEPRTASAEEAATAAVPSRAAQAARGRAPLRDHTDAPDVPSLAIITERPAGRQDQLRGDRFEASTGDVLTARSTVFDFGYSDEVVPPPELEPYPGEHDAPAPIERSSGPLRIFVGRPGVQEPPPGALPPLKVPAPAAASPARHARGRVDHFAPSAWDSAILATADAEDAAPLAALGADDALPMEADEGPLDALPDDLGWDAPLPRQADPFPRAARAAEPLFLAPAPAARSGRPWWVSPDLDSDLPDVHQTGEHRPALPDLELGPARLEEDLAIPLPDEEPGAGVRRIAPWEDPDPWSTGASRRSGTIDAIAGDPDTAGTLAPRRRASRPASAIPELKVVEQPSGNAPPGRLLAGLALVGVVVFGVLQVARIQNGGGSLFQLQGGGTPSVVPVPATGAALPTVEISSVEGPAERVAVQQVVATPTAEPPPAQASPPGDSLPPVDTHRRLSPDGETGLLKITAPPGATIYLDGKAAGRAPLSAQHLKPGMHTIRVGSRSWDVHVATGRLTSIDFTR